MQNWITVFTGLLVLLLTTIGGLVLGRLVFMSKQISENHKEFATAVDAVWNDIKAERRRCSELHLGIERNIGSLQERTTSLREMIDSNKADMMLKYDRTSAFWNTKADAIDRAIASLQAALMDSRGNRK